VSGIYVPNAELLRAHADVRRQCGQSGIACRLEHAAAAMDAMYEALLAVLADNNASLSEEVDARVWGALNLAKGRGITWPAQGTEAQRAETSSGSVHDGPVAESDAP
jgi:hypothetical protein